MGSYRQSEGGARIIARCATCHASVLSHVARDWPGSDSVCATCGMTIFDSPLQGDYFDVAMRIPRRGPPQRPRRTQ